MGIALDSVKTYVFRIATFVNGFISGILIARYLQPSGKGTYAMALLIGSIYVQVFANMGNAITYQITRCKQSPRTVFTTVSVYSGIIGLLTIIVFYLFVPLFPRLNLTYLWPVVINVPFVLILTNLSGYYMGLNRITIVNWLGLGSGLILTLFLFFGFFGLRFGVIQTLYCWMISQVIMVVWGLWLNRKDWWPLHINDHFQPRLLKEMLRFGWQSGLAGLISFLNYRVDMLWIGAILPANQLGIYSLAVGTAELIWWTSSSLSIAICARVGAAEHDEAAGIIAKSVRHTLYINLFLAMLMWPAVHLLLPIVYGEVYRPALEPFQILLPGTLAYGLASILAIYFTIQLGKPRFSVIISSLSMVISMVICYTMIPRIGINGGAWATTISYLVAITVMLIWFCRKSKTPLRELFVFKRSDLRDYYKMLGYFLGKGK